MRWALVLCGATDPLRSDLRPAIIPSDSTMRADIDAFVKDTYRRFLVRDPSEAEKTWFHNYIEADPNVTPEIVYFSFAMSNEYLFY